MFNQRMEKMEKYLDTSTKLLPLINKKFEDCEGILTLVMIDWDKHIVHLVHLGEKVTQLDRFHEDRSIQMME